MQSDPATRPFEFKQTRRAFIVCVAFAILITTKPRCVVDFCLIAKWGTIITMFCREPMMSGLKKRPLFCLLDEIIQIFHADTKVQAVSVHLSQLKILFFQKTGKKFIAKMQHAMFRILVIRKIQAAYVFNTKPNEHPGEY